MAIDPNIQFLSASNDYELVLPDSISNAFGLKDKTGKVLSIKSSNKMQLEWLAQSILKSFDKLNDVRQINRKKLAARKRICVIILLICGIAALLKENIAGIIHANSLYVNLVIFGAAIISCLQLLKYVALGLSDINKGDYSSDPEIEQIKELILKDYTDMAY